MRVGASDAEGLSSEVTAALTLSELQSEAPGQLQGVGDELDQVGIVITARADLVDGFELDPGVLAAELGISLEQATEALAAFGEVEGGKTATITPFLDALVENKIAAEVLRNTFVNLPEIGSNPELDQVLLRLASWLPGALESGELPTLIAEQVADLQTLAAVVDPQNPEGFAAFLTLGDTVAAVGLSLEAMAPDTLREFSLSLFNSVARVHELDSRLAKAAGLPTVADLIFQFQKMTKSNPTAPPEWSALDSWLPAFLAGEGPASTDPAALAMAAAVAAYVGFDGGTPAQALEYLKNGRFLQQALIPGEFEDFDSPMIPITPEGLEMAILAGQRNGVLTEEGRAQIDALIEQVLNYPDGTGGPIELSEEQQQTLIGVIVGQNGEAFLEDPAIQRQLVATLNLIGRQPTLEQQQKIFGDAIEAFRSLAVVGAPAMTYRQLRQAVGQKVDEELSYKDLTARSSDRVGKRPFYLSLLANWGVPGSDTIKTKKKKFSYEFDETGELVQIRKKKISKWKRFKNTLKAFGKAWKQGWKDNPWKALFDTVKIAASVVATIFPPTSGVGLAAITVLAADTAIAIADGDVLGALSSAFSAVGGAAAYFGNVAVAGSTAQIVSQGAKVGGNIVDGIRSADNLIDAIDDGNILGAIGSGFGLLGNVATVVATGAEFADNLGGVFTEGGILSDETLKTVVDTANEVGQTANDLKGVTEGVGTTIKAVEDGDIAGAIIGGVSVLGKGVQAATNKDGILDDGLGISETFAENQETLSKIGTTLVDVSNAGTTAVSTVEAIENDDLIGALSNGVKFVGDAATIVGNDAGFVGGTVGIEAETAKNLAEFGETGSRQFAEGIELTGSAVEGDILGVIENTIDLSQLSADEKSRLAGQLKAADSVLDVARVVESVYNGGDVDLDKLYDEVNEALKDVSEIPEEPPPPPPPPPVEPPTPGISAPGQPLAGGTVVGQTADGAILIDNNGDGRPDAALRPAAAGRPSADGVLDSDGDLIPDHLDLEPTVPNAGGPDAGGSGAGSGQITQTELGPLVEVQDGQRLSEIAEDYGVSVEEILEMNPEITDPDTIQAGQPIDLPPHAQPTYYPSPARPEFSGQEAVPGLEVPGTEGLGEQQFPPFGTDGSGPVSGPLPGEAPVLDQSQKDLLVELGQEAHEEALYDRAAAEAPGETERRAEQWDRDFAEHPEIAQGLPPGGKPDFRSHETEFELHEGTRPGDNSPMWVRTKGPITVSRVSPNFGIDGSEYEVRWHPLEADGRMSTIVSSEKPRVAGGHVVGKEQQTFEPPYDNPNGWIATVEPQVRPAANDNTIGIAHSVTGTERLPIPEESTQ